MEIVVIDLHKIWSEVSQFAIVEDTEQYLKKLDSYLKNVGDDTIYITGKCPIWLYGIFIAHLVKKYPNNTIVYTKPVSTGHRQYKIHPW